MPTKTPSVSLLGVPLSALSRAAAEERLCALLRKTSGALVFTPNPDMLWQAHCSPAFRRLLQKADLLLPDGVGVTLAARLMGTPLPARLPGIDMAETILSHAAEQNLSVFLLGGKAGVAERAKANWGKRVPALRIVGTHHGYFDKHCRSAENQALLRQLQQAKPDILFVCFGSPLQEQWIADNAPRLPFLRLAMGLGGSLDVWSGDLPRAPRLFRRLGLEWLWRSAREPRRLRILFRLPRFLFAVLREAKSKAKEKRASVTAFRAYVGQ